MKETGIGAIAKELWIGWRGKEDVPHEGGKENGGRIQELKRS
jgi:hypothetical protein